jgi:prepilin-type N-terminal cleavage/methylation domain-containing protein
MNKSEGPALSLSKGFTIIELIAAIVIIAVLSAIVLINVVNYINKGKDAAIKLELGTILINAAVYFDANRNYTNFKIDTGYTVPATAAQNVSGGTVIGNPSSDHVHFCVCSPLKVVSTNTYCADDRGYRKETGNNCDARCTSTNGKCSE